MADDNSDKPVPAERPDSGAPADPTKRGFLFGAAAVAGGGVAYLATKGGVDETVEAVIEPQMEDTHYDVLIEGYKAGGVRRNHAQRILRVFNVEEDVKDQVEEIAERHGFSPLFLKRYFFNKSSSIKAYVDAFNSGSSAPVRDAAESMLTAENVKSELLEAMKEVHILRAYARAPGLKDMLQEVAQLVKRSAEGYQKLSAELADSGDEKLLGAPKICGLSPYFEHVASDAFSFERFAQLIELQIFAASKKIESVNMRDRDKSLMAIHASRDILYKKVKEDDYLLADITFERDDNGISAKHLTPPTIRGAFIAARIALLNTDDMQIGRVPLVHMDDDGSFVPGRRDRFPDHDSEIKQMMARREEIFRLKTPLSKAALEYLAKHPVTNLGHPHWSGLKRGDKLSLRLLRENLPGYVLGGGVRENLGHPLVKAQVAVEKTIDQEAEVSLKQALEQGIAIASRIDMGMRVLEAAAKAMDAVDRRDWEKAGVKSELADNAKVVYQLPKPGKSELEQLHVDMAVDELRELDGVEVRKAKNGRISIAITDEEVAKKVMDARRPAAESGRSISSDDGNDKDGAPS